MSFVGKAVKKVFKTAKKVVSTVGKVARKAWGNKWVRIAIIAAACVFTAGIAAGGFAAFSAAAGTGIGGFFGAVGTTMATGYGAITASVAGLFGAAPVAGVGVPGAVSSAATGGVGSVLGGTAASTAVSGSAGILSAAGQAAFAGGAIGGSTAAVAGGGLASSVMGAIMSPTIGGTMLRTGIMGGIVAYTKKKQYDEEREYKDSATVYGGPAFGGSSDLPESFIKKAITGNGDPNVSTAKSLSQKPIVDAAPQSNAQLLDPRTTNQPLRPGAERRGGATDISKLTGVQGLLGLPKVGALG